MKKICTYSLIYFFGFIFYQIFLLSMALGFGFNPSVFSIEVVKFFQILNYVVFPINLSFFLIDFSFVNINTMFKTFCFFVVEFCISFGIIYLVFFIKEKLCSKKS